MHRLRAVFVMMLVVVLLAACGKASAPTLGPQQAAGTIAASTVQAVNAAQTATAQVNRQIATIAAATVQAIIAKSTATPTHTPAPTETPSPTATATPTLTPTPSGKTAISGKICYPSEWIPQMTVYIERVSDKKVFEVPIPSGTGEYQANVEPGTYIVYAWLPDFSLSGGYTEAVPCGLTVSCKDHTLIKVKVKAGETVKGVDVCDWYHGPFDIPFPPNHQQAVKASISGQVVYPGGTTPAVRVVAINPDTQYWFWVGLAAGQTHYTIDNLQPGRYMVFAYTEADPNDAGAYANPDHSLKIVNLSPGEHATGINITDWNNPNIPPDPSR